MTTTIVLRHGPCDEERNLSPEGAEKSRIKGEEVRALIGDVTDAQIQIVTSAAPRAKQTTEHLVSGLGVQDAQIQELDALWDDGKHSGNLKDAFEFLQDLPPHLALIIITHRDYAYLVAEGLGYQGGWKKLPKLGQFIIQDKEEQENISSEDEGWLVLAEDLNRPLKLDMEIPVGDQRVMSLVQSVSILQREVGGTINFEVDGKEITFVVPEISPTGDPEQSMIGKYDDEGYFPVQIITGGELNIKNHLGLDTPLTDLELEFNRDTYVDQLTGVKEFFKLGDPSINSDDWKVKNIIRGLV